MEPINTRDQIIFAPYTMHSQNEHDKAFIVISNRYPFENNVGQYLVAIFLHGIMREIRKIEGRTIVSRKGNYSFAIVNSTVSGISEVIQRYGLATVEDSYRLVIPPLNNAGLLPEPINVLNDVLAMLKDSRKASADDPENHRPIRTTFIQLIDHYCNRKAKALGLTDYWTAAGQAFRQMAATFEEYFDPDKFKTVKMNMLQFVAKFVEEKSPELSGESSFILHEAIVNGDLPRVYNCLSEQRLNLNLSDRDDISPLELALEHGRADILRLLLFFGEKLPPHVRDTIMNSECETETASILKVNIPDMDENEETTTEGTEEFDEVKDKGKGKEVQGGESVQHGKSVQHGGSSHQDETIRKRRVAGQDGRD